jgi:c-di-GMP-binding flagellar brake protein YcgR
MTTNERRHHPRISALNLISYNCIDETEQIVAQGMGRTLNISEGGILLETHTPIDPKNTIALAIGLEDDLINIKGKVVFSTSGKDEKFEAGIEFLEMQDSTFEILKKFIKAFSEQ